MFNFDKDTIETVAKHFRDAVISLFGATITLGIANHLAAGSMALFGVPLVSDQHVHTIATAAVFYLATAGLTLIGAANVALGWKAVRA